MTMYAIYCDEINEKLLPIGDDGVGNIICIGIDGDVYGKVFIWWRDGGMKCDTDLGNIALIDDSFSMFISRVK